MPRSVKPGISFYRMDTGHIQNKKVRLLFNEFDSDGYYIWHALLDYAYGKWGYYFDLSDRDELELFASEFCKKKVTTVKEVIAGCIRRDLFDQAVAETFGILTSDMMQETFLIATSERRAKESVFEMCQDWLLLDFSKEHPRNIRIVPCNTGDLPPNNKILPPKNTQRREEENKPNESKGEESKGAPAGAGADAPPPSTKKEKQEAMLKRQKVFYDTVAGFKAEYSREMLRAFYDYWSEPNKSRTRMRFELEETWELARRLSTWEKKDAKWNRPAAGKKDIPVTVDAQEIDYLYGRFLDGLLETKVITEKHCDYLMREGLMQLEQRFIDQAVQVRIKNLYGGNNGAENRAVAAYQAGTWVTDPDAIVDRPNLDRIAKKYALIDLFTRSKEQDLKTITHAVTA